MAVMTGTARPAAEKQWPEQGRWTYEDWLRLPDDGARYEVIDGVLHVTPPPGTDHQFSSFDLARAMAEHADDHHLGIVLPAPIGVRVPGQDVPLQPDIVFVRSERAAIIEPKYIEGAPDIVVEVLSPSNWPYDRNEKFATYQAGGIPEYWTVDYRARTVEVFALEGGEYTLVDGIKREGDRATSRVLTGFEIAVADVFRGAGGGGRDATMTLSNVRSLQRATATVG